MAADSPSQGAGCGSVVRLSSNENPYGPSPKAFKAMSDAFGLACRYPDERAEVLVESLARLNGVARERSCSATARARFSQLCADVLHGAA